MTEKTYTGELTPFTCGSRYYLASALERVAPPAPAEPVPPEGVTVAEIPGGFCIMRRGDMIASVGADGGFSGFLSNNTPETLEYVAALSRYRAAKHAAEAEREREKLAAVKAAEEAHAAAVRNEEACVMARENAKRLADESFRALQAARKEAGIS